MNIAMGAGTLVGVVGLYFLLAGEVSGDEAIACAMVSAVGLFYVVALARMRSVPLRIGRRGAGAVARSLLAIVPESLIVGRALVRIVLSGAQAVRDDTPHVPFRFGALTDEDIGRRAAVVTALSLAPNGIVLGMERQSDQLIVHQLVRRPIGGDAEWPG